MASQKVDATGGVTLKEYLVALIDNNDKRYEQRFNDTKIAVDAALIAADKAVAAALAGQKEAVTKAEVAAEKRFESVNEFRNTLSDQQRNLMPRAEVDILVKSITDRLNKVENSDLFSDGKGKGMSASWAILVGVVGFIAVLIGIAATIYGFVR